MGSLACARKWERPGDADRQRDRDRDRDLVVRARAGDEEAFRSIVETHQRRVYGVALRMTRSPDAADDVAQESFVRAYRSLSSFELGRPLGPWLTKIAVNLSINRLKARREESLEAAVEPDGGRKFPEPAADSVESDPMRSLLSSELERALSRALDALPAEQKAAFVLKVEEGMQYDEIAEMLSVSPGTVMSRLSRARAKLKEALAPHLDGAGANEGRTA